LGDEWAVITYCPIEAVCYRPPLLVYAGSCVFYILAAITVKSYQGIYCTQVFDQETGREHERFYWHAV
jgi:hypothetical protein